MLRITVEPVADEVRLKLEGDLTGAWVRDLEESWRSVRSGGRPPTHPGLDLTGVTRVDDAGRYLLALIQETGAPIVASAPRPISCSPSPVRTTTLRSGCARARPSPIAAAPPIPPQREKLESRSPAAKRS